MSPLDYLQQSEETDSFQPHPLLAQKLRIWQGEDLVDKERTIITMGLQNAIQEQVEANNSSWWLKLRDWSNSKMGIEGRKIHE